ncbi:MAG: hypothetical protein KDH88_07665 [Chromatiales bacterium]|nr:hypothetical protein [Chromatiales bacterium]
MSAYRWSALLVLIALLGLASAVAWWNRGERLEQQREFQRELGHHSVRTTSVQVDRLTRQLRGKVAEFVRRHAATLASLKVDPTNQLINNSLAEAVESAFPSSLAFALAAPDGTLIADDGESLVGNQCLAEIRGFAGSQRHNALLVHPNEGGFHFDVVTSWLVEGRLEGIFFVSFSLQTLADLLSVGQPKGQQLMLVHTTDAGQELIEVTAQGSRERLNREYYLSDDERSRIVASVPVDGTRWQMVAVRDLDTGTEVFHRIDRDTLLIVAVFALALAGCFLLVLNAEKRLNLAQGRMIQSEKMAALGQMIAGVAHELNTPLGYVRSNMQIVREISASIRTFVEEARRYLMLLNGESRDPVALEEQAERLDAASVQLEKNRCVEDANELLEDGLYGLDQISELVADLRDFSRADHKKFVPYNVNDAIESALVIAGGLVDDKIRIDNQMGELPLIYGVPSQIGHVFLNLVTNAVQALEGGGVIKLYSEVADRRIRVYVSDDGVGMDRQTMARIFEPFFTTKAVGKGTGLGLSIAYHIVAEHHGRIEVESELGKGTTVVVDLPIAMNERRKQSRSRWKRSFDGGTAEH